PKSVYLGNLYVESLEHDTLLFSHSFKVDVDMLGLLRNKVHVNSVKITKFTSHIKRRLPDSSFNFKFIIDAFASPSKPETQKKDTAKKPMDIAVYGIYLHDFYI